MNKKDTRNYGNKELIKDIWSFIKPYKTKFFWGSLARSTSDIVWLFPVWATHLSLSNASGNFKYLSRIFSTADY